MAAHHSRELISVQMAFYQLLKLIHDGVVWKEEGALNLLQQNKYYFVPIVNADGVAYVERGFGNNMKIAKKRKNMNPQAIVGLQGIRCDLDDTGVDLNRNYATSWGLSEQLTIGLNEERFDECQDPCSECYRGQKPFSEPETQALRDFLIAHKREIKFVYNLHSFGNEWMYPYNGVEVNDIE